MADFAAKFGKNLAVEKVSAIKRDITLLLVEVDKKFSLFWVPDRIYNANNDIRGHRNAKVCLNRPGNEEILWFLSKNRLNLWAN